MAKTPSAAGMARSSSFCLALAINASPAGCSQLTSH
jgi:hypothetical protein